MKMEVLKDIFGSDKEREKGIVDSISADELVAKVLSVADKWERSEKGIYPGKEPQFVHYFRDCIEEDMKEGMLLSTRRKLVSRTNSSIIMHKNEKINTSPGYRPHVKCTWTEALVLYRNLVEELNRDKQRAVLKKGSFVLADR